MTERNAINTILKAGEVEFFVCLERLLEKKAEQYEKLALDNDECLKGNTEIHWKKCQYLSRLKSQISHDYTTSNWEK